jgi:acetyl esterase/lipase
MNCHGPTLSDESAAALIRGKPWMVFVHGGEFKFYSNINANYAMLSSRVARAANMGVLNVDFRTLSSNNPTKFPGALHDLVQAFQWLQSFGPSALYLYGDSSGGTQAIIPTPPQLTLSTDAFNRHSQPTLSTDTLN